MDTFKIQVVTDNGIFWWHPEGLKQLRWQGETFISRDGVDAKRKELATANPTWFVQWKRIKAS